MVIAMSAEVFDLAEQRWLFATKRWLETLVMLGEGAREGGDAAFMLEIFEALKSLQAAFERECAK
jgi:hypothetical protein